MSILELNDKITVAFLKSQGFRLSHWGSPHHKTPKNKFYEAAIDMKDSYGLEHTWILYYFPHGFDEYCYLDYQRQYPDRQIWASYNELTIVSNVLKTQSDYMIFIQSLQERTKDF